MKLLPNIYRKIIFLVNGDFFKNVTILASGTVISQVIAMLTLPVITRLYGPEAFGELGVFMSLAGILSAIAALSYPIAIVLPERDSDAFGVVRLSITIGVLISILASVLFYFFGDVLFSIINASSIGYLMFLLPLFMMCSVFSSVTHQWVIRKECFNLSARVSVFQSLVVNSIKIIVGLFIPSVIVLVLANSFGLVVHSVFSYLGLKRNGGNDLFSSDVKGSDCLTLAKKYQDFPFFRAPQVFINTISHSLPIVMLSVFFGVSYVGFYSLAFSILSVPSSLIGTSVMQVFYPKINILHQSGEAIGRSVIKTTIGMAVIGIVPFLIVVVFGAYIFTFIFGVEWLISGQYAQWLSLWLFFNFINKPAVAAVPVLGIQKGLLLYEVLSSGTKGLAIFIGYYVYNDALTAVALFSLVGTLSYLLLILWVVLSARDRYLRCENV